MDNQPWSGRVIDAHGHLGPWGSFAIADASTATLVATMDRCGVATMCVSHLLGIGPDTRVGNALLLEALERYPGRFLGYAVFDPHEPHETDRLADLLAVPGVIGVKLHPDTHEYPLDGPAYEPAFALAAAHRRIVLAHSQHASPWDDPARFGPVAARHPDVPLLMGHAGLLVPGFRVAADVAEQHPNVVLETCGSRLTGRHLVRMVERLGAHRLAFGSDALFLDLRVGLGRVALAPLSTADKEQILFGTMTKLLEDTR